MMSALSAGARSASAEWAFGGFLGASFTGTSRVTFDEPGSPGVSFEDVSFRGEPFRSPPYYALRVARFLDSSPHWGLAVDFTHAKAIASLDGAIGETFSNLQLSHGHNLLTAGALFRFRPGGERVRPYVGLGGGIAIPHVEVATRSGVRTEAYRLAGPAAQALVGASLGVAERFDLAFEYRLGLARIDAELSEGGRLLASLVTQQLTFGFSLHP